MQALKQPSGRMALGEIKRGVIKDHPKRILLYAPEGIGKTTFASKSPSPIFLCAEDGTAEFDIARFPEPQSWNDVLEAITTLRRAEHPYKTLVIDTLDWIEPLCWRHVCALSGKGYQSIEDFGYGKGYVAALDQWRVLTSALDALRRDKGMGIIALAHATIRTFKNPESDDYDRYNLKLNDKAAGLFKEWSDAVLFANYETFASKESKQARGKGVSSGARLIHTERTASFDAKNRFGLPKSLPLSYSDFAREVSDGEARIERAASLKAQIRSALESIGQPIDSEKERWLATTESVAELAEALNRLSAKAAQKEAR